MKPNSETRLNDAIRAIQSDEPTATDFAASAQRIADSLNLGPITLANGQADAQAFLAPSAATRAAVDWSAPRAVAAQPSFFSKKVFGWSSIPAAALLAATFFAYKTWWEVPTGVRAEVRSIDGSAYLVSDAGDRQLTPGYQLREGDRLRTSGGTHAVLRLADGSSVEVNERSELGVAARGQNLTLSLANGAVIVEAAKRTSGHLYVTTPDSRSAVTGTVFSVNSGIKGSRVAVVEGTVDVAHSGADTLLHPGEQLATTDNLSPEPVAAQLSWSKDSAKYLTLLAQFSILQNRIDAISFPAARYSSDLLPRVPATTALYVSIPNLGDFLAQANTIFQDQLKQSPELAQWWSRGGSRHTAEFDSLVDKLHTMSQYLGSEVVIVGLKQSPNASFAVVADLSKGGLDTYLTQTFGPSGTNPGITVLTPATLASASNTQTGQFALIRSHEAVFSNSVATLKQVSAQLDSGVSGFATADFGQQIAAAYTRGAGVIIAADLQQMIPTSPSSSSALTQTGMDNVRYLIAEHREVNNQPENHLNLQFAGERQKLASWLAAPAPIGSLDFVSPNAAIAVAGLSKDPRAIADDILAMASKNGGSEGLADAEAQTGINFRDDIAANLGGDFLVALDGPVLPTPSWKAVVEVHNTAALEQTFEKLAQITQTLAAQKGDSFKGITIQSADSNGQTFYSIVSLDTNAVVAQYTFSDGYMIAAPSQALLTAAIQTHTSGNSLAHSAAFKALLPRDENENYSAVAYQNLGPELTPLLSQFSGQQAAAIQQLAQDARPTAICAWGKDTRIEAASNSHLLGFDFLALASLIHPGNNAAAANVKD